LIFPDDSGIGISVKLQQSTSFGMALTSRNDNTFLELVSHLNTILDLASRINMVLESV